MKMVEIIINVPENIRQRMLIFSGINWSDVFKEAVIAKTYEERIKKSKKMQRAILETLSSKSKLTKEDAFEIEKKIEEGMIKELKDKKII